jgi:ferrous iron transport protein B
MSSEGAAETVASERQEGDSVQTILLVGNPNTGKSTLFNALTGASARVGNFAGTTVVRKVGHWKLGDDRVDLVDLPGTYSLAARSPEERVTIDAVLGLRGQAPPDALVVVGDAPRLLRSLYLCLQLLELQVPTVLALNLMDEARTQGIDLDIACLSRDLGVPVVPLVARSGEGLDALSEAVRTVLSQQELSGAVHPWSDALIADADEIVEALAPSWAPVLGEHRGRGRAVALWMLLSETSEQAAMEDVPVEVIRRVQERAQQSSRDLSSELVATRYAWLDARAQQWIGQVVDLERTPVSDRIDRVLLHPISGAVAFMTVMAFVFTALFAWADPAIGFIEGVFGVLGGGIRVGFDAAAAGVPTLSGPIALVGDLVVDGIVGGVGAVLVFIPQIALLFLFIAILEDCGYLARAAHLMDRVLRAAGLPGQAFVPLLSGYACAVPAIMATRTMPRFRDRLLTIMVVPLTSCSARLPVYTLLIGSLFPPTIAGLALPFQPLMLFGMYAFSTAVTVLAAVIIGRFIVPGETTPAVLELPPYRIPEPRTVLRAVAGQCRDFVQEAGRIILVATVILWALLSFPRYEPQDLLAPEVLTAALASGEDLEGLAAPIALEKSWAGRIGKAMEPAIAPLGYDWKIGVGLVGAFAAREVFVSTMGVVYGIGDVDEESTALRERIRSETRADGRPVYTPLVGLSIMVFFALAMQCLSTLAVLRKETNGWRWPVFVFVYMTALAWISAFIVYQGGRILGFS